MTKQPSQTATTTDIAPLRGTLRVPSDKSLSHRVALFAAMAEGTSQVSGLLPSLDVQSSIAAVAALGAQLDLHLEATGFTGTITGWGAQGPSAPGAPASANAASTNPFFSLDCGNSGTTARLLLGLLSGYQLTALLSGDTSLSRRPMNRVTLPLATMGARFDASHDTRTVCTTENFDSLPLVVSGSANLKAIEHRSPVASAQVKSAVLLAGLHATGTTSVIEPSKSRDHTELLLPAFGVHVEVDGLKVSIAGGQQPTAPTAHLAVPGDPSSAAFLLVGAALIPGSEVTVTDLLLNPTRTGFLKVMQRMGVEVLIEPRSNAQATLGAEQVGSVTVCSSPALKATTVAADEIASLIDELPILALLATGAEGTTVFEDVGELRVKESDRLAAIEVGLAQLGCQAYSKGDTLYVEGGFDPGVAASKTPITMATHSDHRLAMTWTIANHIFGLDNPIDDETCMAVSYPDFLHDLEALSR